MREKEREKKGREKEREKNIEKQKDRETEKAEKCCISDSLEIIIANQEFRFYKISHELWRHFIFKILSNLVL